MEGLNFLSSCWEWHSTKISLRDECAAKIFFLVRGNVQPNFFLRLCHPSTENPFLPGWNFLDDSAQGHASFIPEKKIVSCSWAGTNILSVLLMQTEKISAEPLLILSPVPDCAWSILRSRSAPQNLICFFPSATHFSSSAQGATKVLGVFPVTEIYLRSNKLYLKNFFALIFIVWFTANPKNLTPC